MADYNDLVRAYALAETEAQRRALEQQYAALRAQQPNESNWQNFFRTLISPGPTLEVAAANRAGDPLFQLSELFNRTPARTEEARRLARGQGPAAPQPNAGLSLAGQQPATQPQRQSAAGNDLFSRLLQQESGNRQTDSQGRLVTSPKGAFGAAQLMPGTAAELAEQMGVSPEELRRNPDLNRQAGERYLQQQLQKYGGSQTLALAAYNAGPGKVDEWIRRFGDPRKGEISEEAWTAQIPYAETKNYVNSILGGSSGGPRLSAPTPNDLMRYIPDPESIPQLNFPDAPQQARPAPRPMMELADKNALLAELTAAMQVKPRDQSQDSWDRIQAMLQGAAQGAAQGDGINIGQMLLLAGGGALGGFRGERAEQRAMNKEEEEAQRQVKIALARLGFDIDTANLDTRNQNANINWQSGEDTRMVDFANANAAFENTVREMLTNSGITAQNVGNRNQAAMARGQVGAGALQDQFSVANQAEQLGWQTEQARALAASGGRGSVMPGTRLLLGVGISPDRLPGESPEVTNARSAAGLIEMGNVNAGLNALANELVVTGRFATPDLLDSETLKQVEQLIQQEKVAAAQNLILQKLQAAPGQQQAVVDLLAGQGSLIATMIKARQGAQN